jgi:hypothetical protein
MYSLQAPALASHFSDIVFPFTHSHEHSPLGRCEDGACSRVAGQHDKVLLAEGPGTHIFPTGCCPAGTPIIPISCCPI